MTAHGEYHHRPPSTQEPHHRDEARSPVEGSGCTSRCSPSTGSRPPRSLASSSARAPPSTPLSHASSGRAAPPSTTTEGAVRGRCSGRRRVSASRSCSTICGGLTAATKSCTSPQTTTAVTQASWSGDTWRTPGVRIRLYPLPSWSPESNPVEVVWWSLHEAVGRNHECAGLDDLVELAEGYLEEGQPFRLKLGEVYDRLERPPP